MKSDERTDVVLVRPSAPERAKQDVSALFGISRATSGAIGLSLHLTCFPPSGHSNAHLHTGYETAIYGIQGAVELFYGEQLERSVVLTEGSFCFIPPGLPHKAYNLSETDPASFVTARNDASEQERVVVTPGADDGSADLRVRQTRVRYACGDV